MTDPTPLGDETPNGEKPQDKSFQGRLKKWGLTPNRLAIWILVGGFGIYLLATGIVGLLTKAR